MKDHPDIQQIHFRPELKLILDYYLVFLIGKYLQNCSFFVDLFPENIPKEISIILITLFPLSATNNLVPEEEERYRIEFGPLNKVERRGPSL